MNKQWYLGEMREVLRGLPPEEVQRHLDFYAELIEDRMEEGMSEEAAIAGLEPPEEAARKILQEMPLPTLMKQRMETRKKWGWKEILLVILLMPLWIPVLSALVGALAGVAGLIVGLFAFIASLIIGAGVMIAGFIYTITLNMNTPSLVLLGIGSAIASAGILLLMLALLKVTGKWFGQLFTYLAARLKELVIRRRASHE